MGPRGELRVAPKQPLRAVRLSWRPRAAWSNWFRPWLRLPAGTQADPKAEAFFRRADAGGTTTQPSDGEKVTDKIAQLGLQGWEMVGFSEALDNFLGTRAYGFKRPLGA